MYCIDISRRCGRKPYDHATVRRSLAIARLQHQKGWLGLAIKGSGIAERPHVLDPQRSKCGVVEGGRRGQVARAEARVLKDFDATNHRISHFHSPF